MSLEPFRQLLRAGAPREHIAGEVRRHIVALRALPDTTEGRAEAIAAAEAFLREIEEKE